MRRLIGKRSAQRAERAQRAKAGGRASPDRNPLITIFLLTLAVPSTAVAHEVGISRGEYRLDGQDLKVDLVFSGTEVSSNLPELDDDGNGEFSPAEAERARGMLEEKIVRSVEVIAPSGPCRGELAKVSLLEKDGLSIGATYRCSTAPESLTLRLNFLSMLSQGHRHLATVAAGSNLQYLVAYSGQSEFQIDVPKAGTVAAHVSVFGSLFLLGIEHILTGYDHLVFLLGLILVGGRLRSLFVVVTAFTVAHSITLALAVLEIWAPSPSFVEPAIALSIAYVGVENWFVKDARRRWLITFPFGLIHGFGFAGALQEIKLPEEQIPVALAAFNLGVEAGQMAVLAALLPLVLWLSKQSWFGRRGVKIISSVIAAFGIYWFIDRVL